MGVLCCCSACGACFSLCETTTVRAFGVGELLDPVILCRLGIRLKAGFGFLPSSHSPLPLSGCPCPLLATPCIESCLAPYTLHSPRAIFSTSPSLPTVLPALSSSCMVNVSSQCHRTACNDVPIDFLGVMYTGLCPPRPSPSSDGPGYVDKIGSHVVNKPVILHICMCDATRFKVSS